MKKCQINKAEINGIWHLQNSFTRMTSKKGNVLERKKETNEQTNKQNKQNQKQTKQKQTNKNFYIQVLGF